MIFILPLLLGFANAQGLRLSAQSTVVVTADQLIKEGYLVKSKGANIQAENKKTGAVLSANAMAITRTVQSADGRLGYEDLETTPESKKLLSETFCAKSPEDTKDKSLHCRTITADYCASLATLSDRDTMSSEVRQLEVCGRILEKIDFNEANIKLKHESAMERIKGLKEIPKTEMVSHIGPPRSLFTVAQDFHICKTFEGAWAPAAKKSDRADLGTVK